MATILHITKRDSWDEAKKAGSYSTATFPEEGFIHCSTPQQVITVANQRFRGQSGLVLLSIDTNRVTSPIVYENLEGGEQKFPHIYGELNLDAVIAVTQLEPGSDGLFVLPSGSGQ